MLGNDDIIKEMKSMVKIGSIVWGVRDVARAVQFWSEALSYVPKYLPSEDWAILIPKEGEGIQLSINLVTSEKARRHHMDIFVDDQQAEVERLLTLGAKKAEWRYPPDADYVVLNDPDGNPFCVVQKALNG